MSLYELAFSEKLRILRSRLHSLPLKQFSCLDFENPDFSSKILPRVESNAFIFEISALFSSLQDMPLGLAWQSIILFWIASLRFIPRNDDMALLLWAAE